MREQYEHINFDVFSQEAESEMTLTKEERSRVLEGFYQKAGCYRKRNSSHRRYGIMAMAACMILCLAVSPVGSSAWAAVKEVFMGVGAFLGMETEDAYATVIDQSQTKNGITVTLNNAIASDNELRVSISVKKEDGTVPGLRQVEVAGYKINGINWENGLEATGSGPFGSQKSAESGTYYIGSSYVNFEMPLNPQIDMTISAAGQDFDFRFVLDNEAFKAASKTVAVDKTILYQGEEIHLVNLLVTPIDQKFTLENVKGQDLSDLYLYGEDNLGNKVSFALNEFEGTLIGVRENEDETTYEINPQVKSFTLQAYDLSKADRGDLWNEANAISEKFTVTIH